jgi:starch phosphorylase
MDTAVESWIPTYSGGLGILAGDTLRAAADLGLPLIGVTLLHRKGYFEQHLDAAGNQTESFSPWDPERVLEPLTPRVSVSIEGRNVKVRAWRFEVRGFNGRSVPLLFLDTDLPENGPDDRALTDYLYGGDERYRLCQEVVLGFGGVAILHALGFRRIDTYHLNEGHTAFVPLALLELQAEGEIAAAALEEGQLRKVRRRCVFTTHTPVAAGHDRFPMELVRRVLGEPRARALESLQCCADGQLNMTTLALKMSRYINGVSMRHGEVSREMFPGHRIHSITNGVHAATWTSAAMAKLFDRYVPEWRRDNFQLRYAIRIPLQEIRSAHAEAKAALVAEVKRRTGVALDERTLTVGFARRATAYKRGDLLFSDLDRLRAIAARAGALQVVYAGKAHPRDEGGKWIIRRVFEAAAALGESVRVVYLENYDMALGQLFCAGSDLWLNTPLRPHEASGTSGMKAALNGVPSLSVLDGWWIEGHVEGVTGWAIGNGDDGEDDRSEADSLYHKLENVILPLYYGRPEDYARVMRSAIALNGAFFNTQRMLSQYLVQAYTLED